MKSERPGFVLVALLAGLLVVAAISFALLFLTTLDTLSARSAQRAVIEQAQLQGALDVALATVVGAAAAGDVNAVSTELGPWREHGLAATVALLWLPHDDDGNAVVRLEARLLEASSRAPTLLVARLGPEPQLLWRP